MTTRRPKAPSEASFHERWLGMVQQEGLVVSVPVLTAAGVMHQRGAGVQQAYRDRLSPAADGASDERDDGLSLVLPSLEALLFDLLEFSAADVALGAGLPEALHVVAADAATSVILRPTAAIRRGRAAPPAARPAADPFDDDESDDDESDDDTTASPVAVADDPFADDDGEDDEDQADADADADDESEGDSAHPPANAAYDPGEASDTDPELSDAARVGRDFLALVWDLADPQAGFGPEAIGRSFDRPDHAADWSYPPAAKFERLLRHARVPIGLLTNRTHVRLIYAPHGETSGSITFDLDDLGKVDGRPMLDAFLALLARDRWLTQAEDRRLPALLATSRRQQAEVTERLADQVFDALQALLGGFEAAAQRDGSEILTDRARNARRSHGTGEVYAGLLTVLLRLVFTLYAEDRGLLPVEHPIYQAGYSILGLFDELQADQSAHPDAMDRRFGAWSRLLATWRAIYDGVHHHGHEGAGPSAPLVMPPRRGHLFDPDVYPFLEGRASADPLADLDARAQVEVPSVDDGTLYHVLDALLYLRDGKARQRLSYRALDVEQIGSVYEALMGYDVVPLAAAAVRLRARRAKGVWLGAKELLAVPPAGRAKWLKESVGLEKKHGAAIASAVAAALKESAAAIKKDPAVEAERVLEVLVAHAGAGYGQRADAGRLVIQPGDERKRTSSHYTPQSLTRPVVRRTLAPILRTMEAQSGAPPTSEALLGLKIVDPAMGSGAFLVEVVRQLGDHVVAAWQREGRYEDMGTLLAAQLGGLGAEARPSDGSDDGADPVIAARRLVAQRCVYGVDKNPHAVNLAKLSLWLVTLSRHLPFTFVDHALRCGDSLVGLSLAQVRAFDWRVRDEVPAKGNKGKKRAAEQVELLPGLIAQALERATELRHQIVRLASQDGEKAVLEREDLLAQARSALTGSRLIAGLCLGAFFACEKDKERQVERVRRFDLLMTWMTEIQRDPKGEAERAAREEIKALIEDLSATQAPFHWMLEFPEVFWEGRKDPLVGGKGKSVAYFDAVVGNPPFMGGTDISAKVGYEYSQWLYSAFAPARNRADLCAYFLRQSSRLLGPHGVLGLVTTNTIGQGDTRTGGLAHELGLGAKIYDATVNLRWPAPGAVVTVCIVHLTYGTASAAVSPVIRKIIPQEAPLTREVAMINSRLAARLERPDPVGVRSNDKLSFLGTKIYGQGFLLTPEERGLLVRECAQNAEITKPYIGGVEINSNPDQGFDRYVIDFGESSLQHAKKWPQLLEVVRERVYPERQKHTRGNDGRRLSEIWWQFFRPAPALYAAIQGLSRCIVTSQVTKHLIFSWQPTDRIFSQKVIVIPMDAGSAQVVLQSRMHGCWCWALSSTMKTDLNYSPSDCFQNFPFPSPDPRTKHPTLEPLGERLDALRSAFMLAHQVGLTTTYNLLLGYDTDRAIADAKHALHAPATDPRLAELRELHLDLDQAVLDTYAECLAKSQDPDERVLAPLFAAIDVPPYIDPRLAGLSPSDRGALEIFNDAVLDALMALNEVRARQEAAVAGPRAVKTKRK